MKKMLTPSLILNVILLLIVLGYMIFDKPCKPCQNVTDTVTVTHYRTDTIRITKVVYKPIPVVQVDSFPVYIDTNQAVKDYYVFRNYDILLRDDSAARLSLIADVWKNSLQKAELRGQVYQREKVIEHTVTQVIPDKKRFKAFIGIVPGLSMSDTTLMLSGVVAFQDKRERQYLAMYEPFRKQYEIGLLWKIRFK